MHGLHAPLQLHYANFHFPRTQKLALFNLCGRKKKDIIVLKEKYMQLTVTGKGLFRGIGWTAATLFWLAIITMILSLLSAPSDSGAPYVIMLIYAAVETTFPLLFLPLCIIIYGVRKEHGRSLLKVLLKWGTIAVIAYFICLPFAFALLN